MMNRRFSIIEQYFALLIAILVAGILYNLVVVRPDPGGVLFGSVVPLIGDRMGCSSSSASSEPP